MCDLSYTEIISDDQKLSIYSATEAAVPTTKEAGNDIIVLRYCRKVRSSCSTDSELLPRVAVSTPTAELVPPYLDWPVKAPWRA